MLDQFDPVAEQILNIPDDVLARIQFSMPWQTSSEGKYRDEDGFVDRLAQKDTTGVSSGYTRNLLSQECWKKLHENPQINTSVRGLQGRLTGMGYEVTSEIYEIQEVIEEITYDPRNRLYHFMPKYVSRSIIEGELFLLLTCHDNGFIEIDFIDPSSLHSGGDNDTGIIFHPSKSTFPLYYIISNDTGAKKEIIPSINIARYPDLKKIAKVHKDFEAKYTNGSQTSKPKYQSMGGYYRFIVAWDKGFLTQRAISYLRTTLEWLNHYENLKKYEIDHKKSSGAYAWIFSFEDVKAFKLWLSLSEDDKKKTGIAQKMTPGSRLILPPGMKVEAKNPNLTSIKEQDSDILQMVASGLNEPEDVLTGTAKGTFASVTASRGPMSDRTSDEIAYFDRFQKFDLWSGIFFLKSIISDFPDSFKIRKAVAFDKNQEPVFKNVKTKPEFLIDISYPISETTNFESRAKSMLGVKHGPITDTVGIPYSEIAKKLGFGSYGYQRLKKATEDDKYPELIYTLDAESLQEQAEAEPATKGNTNKKKVKADSVKSKKE